MEIDKVFDNASVDGVADNLFSAVRNSVSEIKAMQQRKAAENVQLVIQALKKIESDLQDKYDGVTTVIEKRVSTIKDGRDGINGRDGRDGKDGRPGKDGMPGARGRDGAPGKDGVDGMDGVSVTDARIDFDGSLIIGLSSGREINVGEVVAPDLAERIKVITNGGGTSQGVLDTLASLQAQINLLSSALVYAGTWNASTNTPTLASGVGTANAFYIVSVAGTTTLNGISNWGVGDWAIFNGTVWQRIEGGAEGNFTNLSVSGNATLGDAVGDSVTVNATATFNNADVTIYGVRVGRGAGAVATNTAVGSGALASNTSGVGQTAVGFSALGQSTGSRNVAFGGGDGATYNAALAANTSGTDNAAFGIGALSANLTGVGNTSLGVGSLYFSTASNNTAIGYQAGYANQTGTNLVLVGRAAGFSNKASNNTFVGDSAGYNNDTGTYNTFVGVNAGSSINTGAKNTIIGSYSGNQGGLDIRTASNYIVLSDGDGNPRAYWNGANPTFPGSVTLSAGTANGVAYLNGSKVLTTGSALTFDGTTFGITINTLLNNSRELRWKNAAGVARPVLQIYSDDNLYIDSEDGAQIYRTLGTERMRLTSTGLGIGTSSPGTKLEVSRNTTANASATGATTRSNSAFAIAAASDTNNRAMFGIDTNTNGWVQVQNTSSNGTADFIINPVGGNLGLGVTPSAWGSAYRSLDVSGFGAAFAGSGSQAYITAGAYNDNAGWRYKGSAFAVTLYNQFDGLHRWYTAPSGTAGNAITFTQAMTLDASGNLALGHTNTPATRLDVRTSLSATANPQWISDFYATTSGSTDSTYGGGIRLYTKNANGNYWPAAIAAINDAGGSNLSALGFYTATSGQTLNERARITSGGNFGIGQTSPQTALGFANAATISWGTTNYPFISGDQPNNTLTFGTQATERARIDSSGNLLVGKTAANTTTAGNMITASYMSSAGTQDYWLAYNTSAAAYRFYVSAAGTISATSTTISAISDQRLKENVRDLDDGLSAIMALKPRKFDWKAGKGKDIKDDRGFIAQEFEQVFPEMIDNWKDPAPEGEEPYKSVRADLIPILVKAIQELKAEFDAYKATHP